MHWLAQGLSKVLVELGVLVATQNFKRNLLLILYKNLTLVVCFFLPLREREKEKMSDT